MCIWQWYRCPDPEMMDITYWMVVYKFGERPVWLNLYDVWGWVYAVNGMALLWCNFRSCSWQLWVESKLKASWFRCLGGEDQQSTWNWDSLMATWDCPKQLSDVFHLTLSQLRPLLYCLDREADFWLLGYFNIFWFICQDIDSLENKNRQFISSWIVFKDFCVCALSIHCQISI